MKNKSQPLKQLPQNVNELQELIAANQAQLSARLTSVARYLNDYPQKIALNTLAEIAKNAHVHPSTLVRFANFFGFNGFSELQKLYKKQLVESPINYRERIERLKIQRHDNPDELPISLLHEFAEGYRLSLNLLEQQIDFDALQAAVKAITQAKEVFICGMRRTYPAASYLYYLLAQLNIRCHLIDGQAGLSKEQMQYMHPEAILVAITFTPYAEITSEAIDIANEKKCDVILITDNQLAPKAGQAKHQLFVHEPNVQGFRSLSATFCLIQTICVAAGYDRIEKLRK